MESFAIPVVVFFIALVFSMFGMGGGLFYMPVFLFFLKSHAPASFLSFLCIFVTVVSAASVYHRKGLIDWRLVKYLGIPLVAVVFFTGFLVSNAPNAFLRDLLGATLILAGMFMVFPVKNFFVFRYLSRHFHRLFPDEQYRFAPVVLAPLIVGIGFLSGMSGVAGGVFEIPVMIGLLGTSPHVAVATSSMIVTLVSFSGILGRLAPNYGMVNFSFALVAGIVAGAFLGGQIGPHIAIRLDKRIFKKVCGAFIFSIGIYFMAK